jgi:hypothetical protein
MVDTGYVLRADEVARMADAAPDGVLESVLVRTEGCRVFSIELAERQ